MELGSRLNRHNHSHLASDLRLAIEVIAAAVCIVAFAISPGYWFPFAIGTILYSMRRH